MQSPVNGPRLGAHSMSERGSLSPLSTPQGATMPHAPAYHTNQVLPLLAGSSMVVLAYQIKQCIQCVLESSPCVYIYIGAGAQCPQQPDPLEKKAVIFAVCDW